MLLPSVKTFSKEYDSIYKQAELIFLKSNICEWKYVNESFTCIVNRNNTSIKINESDGCCIPVCKYPNDFNDNTIKRKQHNSKKGCNIKSLKCKLHVCKYLRESNSLKTIEAIKEIDGLRNNFRIKYDVIWKSISFGTPKRIWIDFYKMYKNIFK